MASKKRKPKVEESQAQQPEMLFTHFFGECVRKSMVRPSQEKEIWAFFRRHGLKEKETPDKYLDALKRY